MADLRDLPPELFENRIVFERRAASRFERSRPAPASHYFPLIISAAWCCIFVQYRGAAPFRQAARVVSQSIVRPWPVRFEQHCRPIARRCCRGTIRSRPEASEPMSAKPLREEMPEVRALYRRSA
ncbi:MAG: hypothetical protein WDN30_08770 [Pararobbsia sp.]